MSLPFLDELLDPEISLFAKGGPQWSTTSATAINGFGARNQNWRYPLHSYDVAYAIRTNEDFEVVRAFFYLTRGAYAGFLYQDWTDYIATAGSGVILTLDDGRKQLARRYAVGSHVFDRPISKPVPGTVALTGGGTLDYATGIVTGGAPTAWTGEFHVPVHFVSDHLPAEIVDRGEDFYISSGQIQLEEVRHEP